MPIRLLCLLLLLPFSLGACGAHTAGSSATTLRIWYSTDDPAERAWSQGLARQFEADHPNIRVQLTDYSFEDLNTKLQLALSTGKTPDLAYVTPRGPGIPVYVAGHQLRDLTAAARQHGWASRLQPGLLASYNQPFSYLGAKPGHSQRVPVGEAPSGLPLRPAVVAVPTALAAVGILYNRRLLARLHLSVPSSLAAFEADLARARQAGYTPIGIGNADGWLGDDWYLTLVNALTSPAALEPEQHLSPSFSFRRPPFLRASQTLQRWARAGYLTPDFGGLDAQEGIDLFFQGKTLFQLVSSSQAPQIMQDERSIPSGSPEHAPARGSLPIGLFAFPGSSGRVMPVSGYLGWVVPRAGRHPAEAISFIDGLLSAHTAGFLLGKGTIPAISVPGMRAPTPWQQAYLEALGSAQHGIYLDAAPVSNLNATMEANVQLLLQGYEGPGFLVKSLQEVYSSHGNGGSAARIDGEF